MRGDGQLAYATNLGIVVTPHCEVAVKSAACIEEVAHPNTKRLL